MPAQVRYRLLDGARAGYMDASVFVIQKWYAGMGVWADVSEPLPHRVALERLALILTAA